MTVSHERRPRAGANQADYQREEVVAALRPGGEAVGGIGRATVDARGLAIATDTAGRMLRALGDEVVRGWRFWRDEVTLTIDPARIVEVLTWLRDDAGFAMLSDISPCDRLGLGGEKRFTVSWVVTKLVPGAPRLRVQAWVDEGETVPTAIGVYPTADWHEREAWDFFGIEFSGREPMRRLLMDDDWEGHPLRKDYPLGGEPAKFTNSLREL